MNFFKKVFGGKKSITSVMLNTQNEIFDIYSVAHPTDAQKMKASVYLCISGIAILNDLGGGQLRHAIDNLVNETRELTKPLRMRVGELVNNAEQLEKIISDFPGDIQITGSTTVNGLAAFEAMYFSMGQDLMNDILTHNQGPMGTPGYAAIVVADGIFGEGKVEDNFWKWQWCYSNSQESLQKRYEAWPNMRLSLIFQTRCACGPSARTKLGITPREASSNSLSANIKRLAKSCVEVSRRKRNTLTIRCYVLQRIDLKRLFMMNIAL